jgi:putative ABC transport system substrate-binding protein
MKRREFITLLCSAVRRLRGRRRRARNRERVRRIEVLMSQAAGDAQRQARIAAFLQGLQQLGWIDGRNVRIETCWGAGEADRIREHAAESAALAPAAGTPTLGPLLQVTRALPVVFVHVPDPVGAGLVDSLARPGGNVTGFTQYEYRISGKWLERSSRSRRA